MAARKKAVRKAKKKVSKRKVGRKAARHVPARGDRLTDAGRRSISKAVQARWAAFRKAKGLPAKKKAK